MFPTRNSAVSSRRGFTLIELMIGIALSSMVIAGVFSTYLFVGRHLTRMANTQQLDAGSRVAFALLNQDVSAAIRVTAASGTQLTLVLPPTSPALSRTVAYRYVAPSSSSASDGTLTRTETIDGTATSSVVLRSVGTLSFNYFNTAGAVVSASPVSVKRIELAFAAQTGSAANGTQVIVNNVSARVALRNRSLLQ